MINFEMKQMLTQIVAFLIMLWILKRYAWAPLLSLLEERKETIKGMFNEAEEITKQAHLLQQAYEQKIGNFKNEGQIIIQKAVKEAKQIAEDLEQKSHKKAQELIEVAHRQCERELQKAKGELKKEMIDFSMLATEKLIQVKFDPQEREKYTQKILKDLGG